MGRSRKFDEREVVDACAALFRRNGYEGTSIDELVAATGLHRGSLYGAFGSKRGLFLAGLSQLPEQPEPQMSSERIDILLVALLELAPHDDEVRRICAHHLSTLSGDVAEALGRRLLDRASLLPQSKGTIA